MMGRMGILRPPSCPLLCLCPPFLVGYLNSFIIFLHPSAFTRVCSYTQHRHTSVPSTHPYTLCMGAHTYMHVYICLPADSGPLGSIHNPAFHLPGTCPQTPLSPGQAFHSKKQEMTDNTVTTSLALTEQVPSTCPSSLILSKQHTRTSGSGLACS